MQSKCKKILILFYILLEYFCFDSVFAFTLNSISVQNNITQSIIILECNTVPVYTIFSLHNPERVVVDLSKISKICFKNIFPMHFDGNNLISRIRSHFSVSCQNIRIVCDLNDVSGIATIIQKKIGKNYFIILTISKSITTLFNGVDDINHLNSVMYRNTTFYKTSINSQEKTVKSRFNIHKTINSHNSKIKAPIVVAIDAGHGGYDPGAMGHHGINEKNITFSIAKRLKRILDIDPMFKTVMIRDGDYFLSVMERSDLARKKKADILISIHVDSAVNTNVRGASVWVLSSRRAQSETVHWLHRKDKHSELLGGLGDVLINYQDDLYFNHLVLDLQFGYAQREGYNIAMKILDQLKNMSFLHKSTPEYSGFGVLRSPDIPSVLVETGFISNLQESRLLNTDRYQEKIAWALYKGLCAYILEYQEKL